MSGARPSLFIVGVGNLLMSDDGVGVHAVAALQKNPIPGVTMLEMGTAILHGVNLLESATRVLVIDAAHGGQPPGTIYQFEPGEPTGLPGAVSLHALGLREAMRFLSCGPPPSISVIGVEPQTIACGLELSPVVGAALGAVIALARRTAVAWLDGTDPTQHAMPLAPGQSASVDMPCYR